jgi:hypothetical protein
MYLGKSVKIIIFSFFLLCNEQKILKYNSTYWYLLKFYVTHVFIAYLVKIKEDNIILLKGIIYYYT